MENIDKEVNERLVMLFNELVKRGQAANNADLGKKTGVGKANIYRVVNQGGSMSIDMLSKIYKTFPGISLHWLMTGEGGIFNKSHPTDQVSEPILGYGSYVKKEEYDRLETLFEVLREELQKSREEVGRLRGESKAKTA